MVESHYRLMYYEAINAIVQSYDKIQNKSLKAQCFLDQLLLKGTQGHNITIEICQVKYIYGDDINFDSLPTEFQVLKAIVKDRNHQAH